MVDANTEFSPPSQPLEYAARSSARVRTSRLAIAALAIAILGCPCLLGSLSSWINWYVPQQFNQVGRYGFVHRWFIDGAMILATLLPVAAMIRIAASRRTRTGMGIAVTAQLISLLWWGLLGVLFLTFSGWRMDLTKLGSRLSPTSRNRPAVDAADL